MTNLNKYLRSLRIIIGTGYSVNFFVLYLFFNALFQLAFYFAIYRLVGSDELAVLLKGQMVVLAFAGFFVGGSTILFVAGSSNNIGSKAIYDKQRNSVQMTSPLVFVLLYYLLDGYIYAAFFVVMFLFSGFSTIWMFLQKEKSQILFISNIISKVSALILACSTKILGFENLLVILVFIVCDYLILVSLLRYKAIIKSQGELSYREYFTSCISDFAKASLRDLDKWLTVGLMGNSFLVSYVGFSKLFEAPQSIVSQYFTSVFQTKSTRYMQSVIVMFTVVGFIIFYTCGNFIGRRFLNLDEFDGFLFVALPIVFYLKLTDHIGHLVNYDKGRNSVDAYLVAIALTGLVIWLGLDYKLTLFFPFLVVRFMRSRLIHE